MSDQDNFPKTPVTEVAPAVDMLAVEAVAGYETVKAYFANRPGWVMEGKACWSSRDKMARIQPDGIGFNLEVWQVDGVPQMLYGQKLEEDTAVFAAQAREAGI